MSESAFDDQLTLADSFEYFCLIFFGRGVSVWSRVGSIALGYCLCEKITRNSAAPNGGQHDTRKMYRNCTEKYQPRKRGYNIFEKVSASKIKLGYNIFEKISAPKIWIQYFRKNISPEILDTIQEKIYRIYILTIFEYNIFEKISVLKIWIQYF